MAMFSKLIDLVMHCRFSNILYRTESDRTW